MITHEQIEEGIALLRDLVEISPATAPDEYDIGHCHYCGARVRNIHSSLIRHIPDCRWHKARAYLAALPSDWDCKPLTNHIQGCRVDLAD